MAFENYTAFGAPLGTAETEEERRRRELQAQMDAQARIAAISDEAVASGGMTGPVAPTPVKETRTIDPATGEVKLKIEGSERDLSAANPNTPTYSGAAKPVNPATQAMLGATAPNNTFNRMMQVESGGRQNNAQGQVLTSPKGAMGIAQVMPTTAMQPGYGVTNIFDLAQQRGMPVQTRDRATAEQLLANRDLNQEFGANYYAALNKKFDGGPGAVAAYNAGPGRVSQNMAANQGQLNVAQLPQETQGYLQKVGMPTPAVGGAQPGPMARAMGQTAPAYYGPSSEGTQGEAQAQQQMQQASQRFMSNQDNVDELMKMRTDNSLPENIRQRANDRSYDLLKNQRDEFKAKAEVADALQNNPVRVAREVSRKSDEGSWFKAILFSAMGLEGPAKEERSKLGIGNKWEDATISRDDGTEVAVQLHRRADGKLLGGEYANGDALSVEDRAAAQAGTLAKGVHVTKVESLIDPVTKQLVNRQTLSNGKEKYLAGGKLFTGDKGKLADAGEAVKQEDRRVNAAYNTLTKDIPNPTQEQKAAALRNAGVPDARIESELGIKIPARTTATPAAGAPSAPATPAVAPVGQPARPVAPSAVFDASTPPEPKPGQTKEAAKAELAAWNKKKDRIEKKAEELPKIETNAADSIATVTDLLTHPGFTDVIGVPNVITGVFSPPGTDARDFKSKYKQLLGEQFLAGFNSLRGGGSITEIEGQQAKEAVAAMQDPYISEKEFRRNAELYVNTLKRAVNRERAAVGLDPRYPGVPEAGATAKPAGGEVDTNNPLLKKKK